MSSDILCQYDALVGDAESLEKLTRDKRELNRLLFISDCMADEIERLRRMLNMDTSLRN